MWLFLKVIHAGTQGFVMDTVPKAQHHICFSFWIHFLMKVFARLHLLIHSGLSSKMAVHSYFQWDLWLSEDISKEHNRSKNLEQSEVWRMECRNSSRITRLCRLEKQWITPGVRMLWRKVWRDNHQVQWALEEVQELIRWMGSRRCGRRTSQV